jgi:hypothetical protein
MNRAWAITILEMGQLKGDALFIEFGTDLGPGRQGISRTAQCPGLLC